MYQQIEAEVNRLTRISNQLRLETDQGAIVGSELGAANAQLFIGLTDFVDQLPAIHATPECHIACDDTKKFGVIEKLARQFGAMLPAEQINLIDGVRITTTKGWCLIRASNTEGALVVRAEGRDNNSLDEFISLIKEQLASADIIWDGS